MALQNLLGDLATDAKLEQLRALLAGTLASVSPGLSYTSRAINITAGMAAGTDPILAANASRRALQFSGPATFQLALVASQTVGMRIYAGTRDSLTGGECPTNALYLVPGSGLITGNTLIIWEA